MKNLKRVFIKGGVLTPGEMKRIINFAQSLGLKSVHFGSRQDIIFPPHEPNEEAEARFPTISTTMIRDPDSQNIVCSYVSADIFPATVWLNGATYLYILEDFKHQPKLKINITDPKQQLVPLFSGQLNFIASEHEDYWYLNLNLPDWPPSIHFPVLIYSWDIADVAEAIENVYSQAANEDELFRLVSEQVETNSRTAHAKPEIDFRPFPYYEGMNKMGQNEYWLGLYWRNNLYDLSFLDSFCDFCLEYGIAKICITPWKSFIIKGIPSDKKLILERLLGRAGINVRHSLLEMNWHLPVADEDALNLKRGIVRDFDQNDISTYGLTFAVTERGKNNAYFTSVVVEKNVEPGLVINFQVRSTYNVLYSKNFNPNTQKYLVHAQNVDAVELPGLLMQLSKMYFEQFGIEKTAEEPEVKSKKPQKSQAHQCAECLTVYSDLYGDQTAGIAPNTSFQNLPADYACSVCEAPAVSFVKVLV